jgi:hypothetical protein
MSAVQSQSFFTGAWAVTSDLLIATALLWAPPLVLGSAGFLVRQLILAF